MARITVEPADMGRVFDVLNARFPDDGISQISVLMACMGWMSAPAPDAVFEEMIHHLRKSRAAYQQHNGPETITIRRAGHD